MISPRLIGLLALVGASIGSGSVPSVFASEPEPEWAGSEVCHTCHRGRFSSWHRTYHRTMTRNASEATVQGRFDGQPVTQWGMTVRPVREGGQYFFEYLNPGTDRVIARHRVARTVGSNRYQQYLTRDEDGGNFYRLHMLWHNGDERWVHTNAAFLGPDDQQFDDQVSVWNNNCIFCHNTGPEPNVTNYDDMVDRAAAGEAVNPMTDAEYDSNVSELGIACESCHGPAAAHVDKHANPLVRAFYTLTGRSDDSIVNPAELERDAATQVCGQCHGQRIPRSVDLLRTFLDTGPVYRPGDDLFETVELVWPETELPVTGHSVDFGQRFWNDRTPRLTAYEYQGLLLSECHTSGEMTCGSCHTMHEGDPKGMLTDTQRGGSACLDCHQDIAADPAAHTHHPVETPGSDCLSCHMPEMVYGVMEIHRSHRIEVPDAAADAHNGRPNACTLCHVDESLDWAEQQTARLWQQETQPVERLDGIDAGLADGIARLHGGDPVERAVMAVAIGRSAQRGQLADPEQWRGHLLAALDDDYPAVRRFARRALGQIEQVSGRDAAGEAVEGFDPLLLAADRERALGRLMARYRALEIDTRPRALPDALTIEALRAIGERRSEAINIGE